MHHMIANSIIKSLEFELIATNNIVSWLMESVTAICTRNPQSLRDHAERYDTNMAQINSYRILQCQ